MTESRPVLPTRVGRADQGENRFFGHRVGSDLLSRVTLTDLTCLGVTGHLPDQNQRRLLDETATVLSSADPRIWLFKAARVGSAYGGIISGLVSGMLCLHRASVGHMTASDAARTLQAISLKAPDPSDRAQVSAGVSAVLETERRIVGFGVPFRDEDERAVQLTERLRERGLTTAPYFSLYLVVGSILRETHKLAPNLGGCLAASMLDAGFSPDQIGPLVLALGQHTFFANAIEGAAQAPALLQRLPDDWVDYVGPPPRTSPRSAQSLSPT